MGTATLTIVDVGDGVRVYATYAPPLAVCAQPSPAQQVALDLNLLLESMDLDPDAIRKAVYGDRPCSHGVRPPHECKACADEVSDADVAAWMTRAALAGEETP